MSKKKGNIVTTQPLLLPVQEPHVDDSRSDCIAGSNYLQFPDVPLHICLDGIVAVYTAPPYDHEKRPEVLVLTVIYSGGYQVEVNLYCEDASSIALVILEHLHAKNKVSERLEKINGKPQPHPDTQSST